MCACFSRVLQTVSLDAAERITVSTLLFWVLQACSQIEAAALKAVFAVDAAVVADWCLHLVRLLTSVISIPLSPIRALSAGTALQQHPSCTHNAEAPIMTVNGTDAVCFCFVLHRTEAHLLTTRSSHCFGLMPSSPPQHPYMAQICFPSMHSSVAVFCICACE